MPKDQHPKVAIHLDLLRPQSNPEKLFTKLLRWLLSSGRYIFVFVEALVLIAFIARFKLDADLSALNESIDLQIPYIESLKPFEVLIRQTQLKLSTIDSFRSNYVDFSQVLKKISDQTPQGVKVISLNFERNVAEISIQINAEAQNNNDLATFIGGLQQDPIFTNVAITGIGLERGLISFSIKAQAKVTNSEESNL